MKNQRNRNVGNHRNDGHYQNHNDQNENWSVNANQRGSYEHEMGNDYENDSHRYGRRTYEDSYTGNSSYGGRGYHNPDSNERYGDTGYQNRYGRAEIQGTYNNSMNREGNRSYSGNNENYSNRGSYGHNMNHDENRNYAENNDNYSNQGTYRNSENENNYRRNENNQWGNTRNQWNSGSSWGRQNEDHGNAQLDRQGSNYWGVGSERNFNDNRGKGPKNYSRSKERIIEDINDRLSDDRMLDASDIEVKAENSTIILSGTVDTKEAKRRAEDIAESISGVSNVENRIRLKNQSENTHASQNASGKTTTNQK